MCKIFRDFFESQFFYHLTLLSQYTYNLQHTLIHEDMAEIITRELNTIGLGAYFSTTLKNRQFLSRERRLCSRSW